MCIFFLDQGHTVVFILLSSFSWILKILFTHQLMVGVLRKYSPTTQVTSNHWRCKAHAYSYSFLFFFFLTPIQSNYSLLSKKDLPLPPKAKVLCKLTSVAVNIEYKKATGIMFLTNSNMVLVKALCFCVEEGLPYLKM